MKLKTINNNKGSALLWCILMTIVITILLGSIMAATYAYFNYTMFTVKRQQAYFTCRSAIDAVISELSSTTTSGKDPDVLPKKNQTLTLSDFEIDSKLGQIVEATITRESPSATSDTNDKLIIKVKSEYAGEQYAIEATLLNQPLYFAGIALKTLDLNGDLRLGKNTDLYWNNDSTFQSKSASGKTITINGNLVTKKDAKIAAGTVVAGHKLNKDVSFTATGKYQKQIWNPSEYIISNKKLDIFETSTTYKSSTLNNLRTAFNGTTTTRPCNNTNNNNTTFGNVSTSLIGSITNWGASNIGFMNDLKTNNNAFDASNNNALTIQYIKFVNTPTFSLFGGFDYLTCRDISYIEYNSNDNNTRSDRVIPVVYLFADDGQQIRIQFGKDPGSVGIIGRINDWITSSTDRLISRILDVNRNMAYVIVYLGKNSKLELGCPVGVDGGVGSSKRTDDNLIFAYSIYGEEGSELVLNDGVTILGEIDVNKVTVKPGSKGVNVVYSTSNGSQIAKQKVDQYWAVAQYKEGTK